MSYPSALQFLETESVFELTLSIPLPEATEEVNPLFLISLPTFFTSNSKATFAPRLRTAERGAVGVENALVDLAVLRMDAGRGRDVILFIIVWGVMVR